MKIPSPCVHGWQPNEVLLDDCLIHKMAQINDGQNLKDKKCWGDQHLSKDVTSKPNILEIVSGYIFGLNMSFWEQWTISVEASESKTLSVDYQTSVDANSNIHPNASCQKPPLLRRCSPKYYSSSKFRDIKFMDTIWVISGLMNDYRNQLPDQRATLICCSTRVLKSNLIVNALPWLPERLEKSMEKWGICSCMQRFISQEKGDANLQDMKNWRLQICQSDSFLIPTRLLQTLRAAARVFSGKKKQASPTANKDKHWPVKMQFFAHKYPHKPKRVWLMKTCMEPTSPCSPATMSCCRPLAAAWVT